jgi:Fe2+ or Zn2+ uptake regulation protein
VKPAENVKKIGEFFDNIDFIKEAKQHFMIIHAKEIDTISKNSLETLKKELEQEYEKSEKLNLNVYGISNKHIKRWKQTLA